MNIKEAGYNMGIFHGAIKHSVDPLNAHKLDGIDETLEDHFRKTSHMKVMRAAHKILCVAGHGQTKEARLVDALSQVHRETSSFIKQASNIVFDTIFELKKYAALAKRAEDSGFVSETAGNSVKLLSAAAAIAGAGAGGLYWGLSRDAEEQNAKNKMKRQKIDYYHTLASELKERLGSSYG